MVAGSAFTLKFRNYGDYGPETPSVNNLLMTALAPLALVRTLACKPGDLSTVSQRGPSASHPVPAPSSELTIQLEKPMPPRRGHT